jgi:hypothetical protein
LVIGSCAKGGDQDGRLILRIILTYNIIQRILYFIFYTMTHTRVKNDCAVVDCAVDCAVVDCAVDCAVVDCAVVDCAVVDCAVVDCAVVVGGYRIYQIFDK